MLDGDVEPVRAILTRQREVLEQKRRVIDRALRALASAERRLESDSAVSSLTLDDVIGAIGMPDIDAMRKYFSDEVWSEWKQHFEDWPPLEWRELFRDVGRALDDDPAGAGAQALADRWLELNKATRQPPAARLGMRRAWLDRDNWPPELKRRLAQFDVERAVRSSARRSGCDGTRSASTAASRRAPRVSQRSATSFTTGHDPATTRERARPDLPAAGGASTGRRRRREKARIVKSFENRRLWPLGLKRYHATLFDTDLETWERVELIEQAGASEDLVMATT